SGSRAGIERVRRAVDRVLFAGGEHLLSRDLLVRRQRRWEVLTGVPSVVPANGGGPPVPSSPAPAPSPRQTSPAPAAPPERHSAGPLSAPPERYSAHPLSAPPARSRPP